MSRLAIKTILAATDLSRAAFTAVQRAACIARDHEARLEVLHVVPQGFGSSAWDEIRSTLGLSEDHALDTAAEQLKDLGTHIATEFGVDVHTHVAEGRPFAEIAARADEIEAGLVVVGAHGENVLLSPMLGTTAHRVLRLSGAPVVLARTVPATAYERVIIATDFSEHAARAAQYARPLVAGARVFFMHAYVPAFESRLSRSGVPQKTMAEYQQRTAIEAHAQMDRFVAALNWPDAFSTVRHGPATWRLREYAQEVEADLIVFGARAKPMILGSVSMHLVTEAQCDLLLA